MIEIIVAIITTVVAGLILHWLTTSAKTREVARRLFKKTRPSSDQVSKLLIYLSSGGTCRDPMAKVITQKVLAERAPQLKGIRVEGMALGPTSKPHVSFGARRAIEDLYGQDLLAGYVPKTVTGEMLEEADLVLVMDRGLLTQTLPKGMKLPKHKTYVFKEFFGLQGDIEDPWPDGRDQETLSRYRHRAAEIREVLEVHFDRLIDIFDPLAAKTGRNLVSNTRNAEPGLAPDGRLRRPQR